MSFFLSGIPIPDTQDIGDSLAYINKAFLDLDTASALLCAQGKQFATLRSNIIFADGTTSVFFLPNYVNDISDNYIIYFDGVKQLPNIDYTVSSDLSCVIFYEIPPAGVTLEIITAVAISSFTEDTTKLPLIGGTLTGNLTGTSAVFNNSVRAQAFQGNVTGSLDLGSNGSISQDGFVLFKNYTAQLTGLNMTFGGELNLPGNTIDNSFGKTITGSITADTGTFVDSISAPIIRGVFYGDGSNLTGVATSSMGSLSGIRVLVDVEVLTASSNQTVFNLNSITYAPGVNSLSVYRNGLKLIATRDYIETSPTVVTLVQPVAIGSEMVFEAGKISTRLAEVSGDIGTFAAYISAPAVYGKFYGDGSSLTGISTQSALPLSGGTLSGPLIGTTGTFSTSVSAPALSGTFFGDGSRLTGIVSIGGTANALPLSGGTLTGDLSGTRATFSTSVSAPALSGTFFGDGSRLTGITSGTANALPLSGGTLSGALSGTRATFSTSVSAPALSGTFFGDGSRLTGITSGTANALPLSGGTLSGALSGTRATFSTSVSAPDLSGTFFGDGSRLTGVLGTDNTKLPLAGGTLQGNLIGRAATFATSVSAPALSGTFFGDGSKLTGIVVPVGSAIDTTKLPLSGGTLTGPLLGTTASFTTISGVHLGNGSGLTGVVGTDPTKLPLAGGTLSGPLIGTTASFNTVTGTHYGNGSNLTNISASNIVGVIPRPNLPFPTTLPHEAGIVKSDITTGTTLINPNTGVISVPIANAIIRGLVRPDNNTITINDGIISVNGSSLSGVSATDSSKLPLSGGALSGALNGTIATFSTSVSAPALSGTFFGDGSRLTGIVDHTKLPVTGGTVLGSLTLGTSANVQLGSDIDGEALGDWLGYSVSMNAAGDRVAIGAIGNDGTGTTAGHVRVYSWNWNGSTWTQLGQDIDGEAAGDSSGISVSMNAAGDRVAIGANSNDGTGSYAGHVRVYSWNGSTWTRLGLDIDGEAADDQSGISVSMNAAGDRVAIGARYNNNNAGHVRIYSWNGSTWTKLGSDIDGEAAGDQSGYSVSMNATGDRVAIGAIYNDGTATDAGHVRVYSWNGSTWTQLGLDIDGEAAGDQSGTSVSMNAAGDRVAIGAFGNDDMGSNAGHVRIYSWNGSAWTKLGSDIDGEAAGDQSGYSVSMNATGDRVAIGARFNNDSGTTAGHVRVYSWNGSTWTKLGLDIDGEAAGDQSGTSVSMNAAGDRVAIGAIYNDGTATDAGHVRIYYISQSSLTVNGKGTFTQSVSAPTLLGTFFGDGSGLTFNGINTTATDGEVLSYNQPTNKWIARDQITSGTPIALTNQTSVSASIPSWAKRVTFIFNRVSTTGTSMPLIQLGTPGGFATTGYSVVATGDYATSSSSIAVSNGFHFRDSSWSSAVSAAGMFTFTSLTSATWIGTGNWASPSPTAAGGRSTGSITLTSASTAILDRVRLTTVNGTDQFDAGLVNVMWE